jgi:FixJ family two-component response regulator
LLQAGTMTTATIMHAIRLRFAIEDPVADEELDSAALARSAGQPEEEAIIGELVIATLAELTSRQAQVLIGIYNEVPGRELAMQLGCSTGTISFERSRIAAILARLGTDAPKVLNRLLDALFIDNG